jgi:hypothetical protein
MSKPNDDPSRTGRRDRTHWFAGGDLKNIVGRLAASYATQLSAPPCTESICDQDIRMNNRELALAAIFETNQCFGAQYCEGLRYLRSGTAQTPTGDG